MKEALISSIGETLAICPYCRNPLEKKPVAEENCPHCGNYIFVRTRPHDHQRILVKGSELYEVEYLWNVKSILDDIEKHRETIFYLATEKRLNIKYISRHQIIGLADVIWLTGGKKAVEHELRLDYERYRNQIKRTAEYLQKLRDDRALYLFLEVCYLDLNGPKNLGSVPRSMLREYSRFDKREAKLDPDVIDRIKTLCPWSWGWIIDEPKQHFLEFGYAFYKNSEAPVHPKRAWASLEKELRA